MPYSMIVLLYIPSLPSKRLNNRGRAVLGNAGGTRSTREGKGNVKLALLRRLVHAQSV